MLISMAFICAGIAWINLPAIMQIVNGQGNGDKAFGALLALLGVLSWSWFALRNARQMKTLRFSPSEWSTLQGMVTGRLRFSLRWRCAFSSRNFYPPV